jgi:Flp pilus assembly protein TadD
MKTKKQLIFRLTLAVVAALAPGGGAARAQSGDISGGAGLIVRQATDPKVRRGSSSTPSSLRKEKAIERANAARRAPTPRYTEAEEQYRLAASLDDRDPRPHAGLGNIFNDRGQYEKAVEEYKKAITIDPGYVEAYFPLGYAYTRLNRFTEAAEVYRQLLKLRPDYAEAYNNLGYVHNQAGNYEDAIAACKEVLRLVPESGQAYLQEYQAKYVVLSQAY